MNKLLSTLIRTSYKNQLTLTIRGYKTKGYPYLDPLLDPKYSANWYHEKKFLVEDDDEKDKEKVYCESRICIHTYNPLYNNEKSKNKLERYVERYVESNIMIEDNNSDGKE
jgi:hypothetical protein